MAEAGPTLGAKPDLARAEAAVIAPFHNGGSMLGQTCGLSLQRQNQRHWQALLANDHSDAVNLHLSEAIVTKDRRCGPAAHCRNTAACPVRRDGQTGALAGQNVGIATSQRPWRPASVPTTSDTPTSWNVIALHGAGGSMGSETGSQRCRSTASG